MFLRISSALDGADFTGDSLGDCYRIVSGMLTVTGGTVTDSSDILCSVEPFLGEEPIGWAEVLEAALLEDIGLGDVTRFAVPEEAKSNWFIEAQAEGICCGIGLAQDLLVPLGEAGDDEYVEWKTIDGAKIKQGTKVLQGRLNTRELLRNERTALNFLMQLSGVSTLTARFVEAVKGTGQNLGHSQNGSKSSSFTKVCRALWWRTQSSNQFE